MKMKTAVQNFIANLDASSLANRESKAAANGMTIEQLAASELATGDKAVLASAEFAAICRDKAACIAAFDRIALIPETDKGSCYIPVDKIIAAFVA